MTLYSDKVREHFAGDHDHAQEVRQRRRSTRRKAANHKSNTKVKVIYPLLFVGMSHD